MAVKGKIAIVTGAGQGIGEGIAVKLATEGASVVVTDIAERNHVAEKIGIQGGNAIAVKADVSNKAKIQNLVKDAIDKFKTIHILVNNAGITRHGSLIDIAEEDWNATLNVDLKGGMLCSQAVLPYMIKN